MLKKDIIAEINSLQIKGVAFDENTETTVPVLELVLKGATADAQLDELSKKHKEAADSLRNEITAHKNVLKDETKRAEEAEELLEELTKEMEQKDAQIEELLAGSKKVLMPSVNHNRASYVFTLRKFKFPKEGVLTAEAAAEREDLFPEFIKRGILVKKEG